MDDDERTDRNLQPAPRRRPARSLYRCRARISRRRQRRGKQAVMRVVGFVKVGLLSLAASGALGFAATHAYALDQSIIGSPDEKRSPWAVFRLGFTAYKSGHKEQ